MAEKRRRDAEGEVQYLTEAQLDSIVEQNPGSDIRDYEDLQTGTGPFFEVSVMCLTFVWLHCFVPFQPFGKYIKAFIKLSIFVGVCKQRNKCRGMSRNTVTF